MFNVVHAALYLAIIIFVKLWLEDLMLLFCVTNIMKWKFNINYQLNVDIININISFNTIIIIRVKLINCCRWELIVLHKLFLKMCPVSQIILCKKSKKTIRAGSLNTTSTSTADSTAAKKILIFKSFSESPVNHLQKNE